MVTAEVVDTMHDEQITITYYDGSARQTIIQDVETPYPEGRLIVSRTDTKGIITQCNQSFIDMSGYSEKELIGQPHSILRHPDMPKAAFKDLWDTLQSGKKWHGYVKNLCKDGTFYWVYATAIPNIRNGETVGYTSVRRKPSRKQVNACIKLYASMKKEEEAS
jgi:aerotaxis receptor